MLEPEHPEIARLAEVRRRLRDYYGWIVVVAASLAASALILYLTRDFTFSHDEWIFIVDRRFLNPHVFLAPMNGHLLAMTLVVYQLLFATVGVAVYWPYMTALVALHVGSALVLFALVRSRNGDLIAVLATLILLFLGAGAECLVWAALITNVGSVFTGLLAMLLLNQPAPSLKRLAAASAALLGSLAFSDFGVFFLIAVGVWLLLASSRRRSLVALGVPMLAYLAWLLTYGRGQGSVLHNLKPANIPAIVGYVKFGLAATLDAIIHTGSPFWATRFLLLVILIAIAVYVWRRRFEPLVVGAAAGLLAQFTVTGLARFTNGPYQAGSSRYVYVGAVFLLLILSDILATISPGRAIRALTVLAVVAAMVAGIVQLRDYKRYQYGAIRAGNAELQTVAAFRHGPDLDRDGTIDPLLFGGENRLTPARFLAAIDALKAPISRTKPADLLALPPANVDGTMERLFGQALTVRPLAGQESSACMTLPAQSGVLTLTIPSTDEVIVEASSAEQLSLSLGYLGPPPAQPITIATLNPGRPYLIHLPDTGVPIVWRLRLQMTGPTQTAFC